MSDIRDRAIEWFAGDDIGLSSKAIATHMLTGKCNGNYPSDPGDLGRCLRLLKLIPEWKLRISEMAQYGTAWIGLAKRWEEISASMMAEVGIDWSKGDSAPKTYAMMKQAIAEGYRADKNWDCTFYKDGTLQSAHKKDGGASTYRLNKHTTVSFGR